jgi:putative transcriptional regulator
MSKKHISKVVRFFREKLPPDKTDWARINAMTARSDPDAAQPLTGKQLARMRRVPHVKLLRQRLDMTQVEFAEAFHLPITTLRDWEQHSARQQPNKPTRKRLLHLSGVRSNVQL